MEKIWLEHYPEGVPAEIDPRAYASIVDVLEQSCRHFAARPAFANMGRTLTFADLDRLSRNFAAFLQHGLGLAPGERVAVMMPNILQYPVAMFGVLRAGLVVVNVNPLYTPRELAHQLKDSGAATIMILANFAHVLAQIIEETEVKHAIVTEVGDLLSPPKSWLVNLVLKHVKKAVPPFELRGALGLKDALTKGAALTLDPLKLSRDDTAFLQYTGGTTGAAKGAVLTHGNMVANMQQISAALGPSIVDGEEVMVTALPLYHIFCLCVNGLAMVKHGALNLLITNPRDIAAFVKTLSKSRFTMMTGVNTLFNALINNADFAKLDFSGLKNVIGGGMAVQAPVAEKWQRITGRAIAEGYGLTETSPVVCCNPYDTREYNGTIGPPIPSTDISIRNDSGAELPCGEPGELCVKGPQVMHGYWRRPEESRQSFTRDGWLRTGDVATVDERGFVRIVDRKKDMINVSGFNVYPNEVENVVAMHPDVLECACVGEPDAESGERVKVFVVARPGASVTLAAVRAHCKQYLTGYKIPHALELREELPKSNVGKILRKELRAS